MDTDIRIKQLNETAEIEIRQGGNYWWKSVFVHELRRNIDKALLRLYAYNTNNLEELMRNDGYVPF
jgi:hypothetical protein